MLKSGADVKIGDYEFMLATDLGPGDNAYDHVYEYPGDSSGQVEGDEGVESPDRELRFWRIKDWLAGEGQRYFKKDNPDRYWYANANTRIPGSITSPPTRTAGDNKTAASAPGVGIFVPAGSRLWFFAGREGWFTTNGTTWTENADVQVELETGSNHEITAATFDGDLPWVAGRAASSNRIIRVDSDTVANDAVTDRTGAGTKQYDGAGMVEGQTYWWNGGRLFRYDSSATIPIANATTDGTTENPVYKPFIEAPTGSLYHDLAAGETSVFMLKGGDGKTVIYEYKNDISGGTSSGRSIWNMPPGFTGKFIEVSLGILYVAGDYNGRLALFGMSLVNRQPLFLGFFGEPHSGTHNLTFLAGSYGPQVMIGMENGTNNITYIYDAEEDAFSQLDENSIATFGTAFAAVTWKQLRIVAYKNGTALKFNTWAVDTATPTGAWEYQSPAWDVDRPEEEKTLFGFHILQDPQIAGGNGTIYFQINESGTWVNAGNFPAGQANTYLNIVDDGAGGVQTYKFRTLRIKVTGASGARVFSVTPRIFLSSTQEKWRLVLDLRNEAGTSRRTSKRTVSGSALSGYLDTLANARAAVTFLDGRPSPKKGTYRTDQVVIESVRENLDSDAEGTATVVLRKVTQT